MRLQEQGGSVDGAHATLDWLVWLLPGLATVILILYVLSATIGLDPGATGGLIAKGQGGDLLAYLVRLSLWGFGQITQVMWQNGPLVLVVAAVAALVWVVRQF